MEMGIASLSMSMSAASTASDVSLKVLNMAMDTATTQSAEMVQMIDSCDPNVGNNVNALV